MTIKSEKGDRHLNHLHFETEAKITADGKLIAEAPLLPLENTEL